MIIHIDGWFIGISENGCHNHGCLVKSPIGQATNGPCTCFDHVPKEYRIESKKLFQSWKAESVNNE